MGLFGDIFRTITAPGRFVAKSPLGQLAKQAAPLVMGPAGIGVSAGLGVLENTDEDVGDMLKGGVTGGGQGALSYGAGKGVGALIGKMGGAGAGEVVPGAGDMAGMDFGQGAVIPGPVDLGQGASLPASTASVADRAVAAGAPSTSSAVGSAAGEGTGFMDKLGLGDMPPWLKWSMLLKGGTDLAGTMYDVYDNERGRARGERFANALVGDQTSRRRTPTNYGSSYDPAGDVIRRRRQALEREF